MAVIFVGDVGALNSTSGWELRLSNSALQILRVSDNGSGKSAKRVVGTVPAAALPSGLPVDAWNLLRLKLLQVPSTSGPRETMSVFLNPTADATSPTLGKVTPRLVVTEDTARKSTKGCREIVIRPPAAGEGYFMVDYVSALPARGGLDW